MTQAVSFERLYFTDRMKRVLFVELIASTSVVVVLMAAINRLSLEGAVLGAAIVTALALTWSRWETKRRTRRLTLATVVRTFFSYRREQRPPTLPLGPILYPYVAPVRGYLVEAATKEGLIRYMDHEPRSEGERLLLLLDGRGRVLATSRVSAGVRLDLLLRLR
ncbi:MAG: hypothetical protein NZ957_06070 [Thaumarchaeota archaeon]|nr:hypothetical protein [Candidatus Calditenuaceae archaeon]MDW8042037.1 hypothetical protein [Nitrososphaerota archaeon]